MLVTILFWIINGVLGIISFIFIGIGNFIGLILPQGIQDAFIKLFSYAHILDGILPMNQILLAGIWIVTLEIVMYGYHLILKVLGGIRGHDITTPKNNNRNKK